METGSTFSKRNKAGPPTGVSAKGYWLANTPARETRGRVMQQRRETRKGGSRSPNCTSKKERIKGGKNTFRTEHKCGHKQHLAHREMTPRRRG